MAESGTMGKVVGAVVGISVSVIVIASVLAPTITDYTGPEGALVEYKGLLGAIIIMSIVAVLMIAVRLISNRN